MARWPPYQSTMSAPVPPTMPITGTMKPRTRARRRLSSWKRSFRRTKVSTSCSSHAYDLTTCMPVRFSCTRFESSPSPSWTRSERRQREPHVVGEHEGQAVDVGDGRVDEVQDPRAEQHAHRRHVVHQARHEIARVPLLVEGEREGLQVTEEVVPQVVLDVAPDVEDDEARERPHQALDDGDRDDQPEIAEEHAGVRAGLDRVHAPVEEPGDHHRERGGADEARDAAQVAQAVAPDVAPEAGHRANVPTRRELTQW